MTGQQIAKSYVGDTNSLGEPSNGLIAAGEIVLEFAI
jgi:hypothetical protein